MCPWAREGESDIRQSTGDRFLDDYAAYIPSFLSLRNLLPPTAAKRQ